jgi:PKD repeat protein
MSRFVRGGCAAVIAAVMATFAVGTGTASAAIAQGTIVTATPSDVTPYVLDNRVLDLAEVGDRIVVAGDFTQVRDASSNGGEAFAQPYVFAFDKVTGRIDRSFAPAVAGQVNAVEAGPDGTVYLGGTFATVNGTTARNLAQVSLATGARVPAFAPSGVNGAVNDLDLAGGRLYLGGFFNAVQGAPHGGLATVNPTTGAVDEFLGVDVGVNHNWPTGPTRAAVGVKDLDVSPDGSRLVAIGNFKLADGISRDQVVSVLLPSAGAAVVDPNWHTRRYEPACSTSYDYYVRDVDFAPDGSYFVIVTTGAKFTGTLCDTAARWDVGVTGTDLQPRWVAETGGDTLHSVAITGAAVYVGGHQRWLNNPLGADRARGGAVPRPGLGALDPRTGIPLSWNPGRNPRGIGAEALLATSTGLYVGSDTEFIGNRAYYRPRLASFPLAGGTELPREDTGAIPGNVYLAGRSVASGGVGTADVISRSFDGTTAGPNTGVSAGGIDWGRVRGAFLVDGTLYYAWQNNAFSYSLMKRSFDGRTFGPASGVDPYNDPAWSAVDTGSNTTFRGAVPSFYSLNELPYVTAMAYRDGRLYYTLSNSQSLFYRNFSPDSGVMSETRFVAATTGFGSVSGLILSGSSTYVASSADGALRKVNTVTGASAVVSGPAVDGRDWRTRALFLGPTPNKAPVAAFTTDCLGLACAFDGTGSSDADGAVASYAWDFGDGTTATGPTPRTTFATEGERTVRLTVTDDEGATTTVGQVVSVEAPSEPGIALRASAGTTARPVTSVSLDVPAAVQPGDGLVMVLSTNSAVIGTAPAGWTAAGVHAAGTAMTTQVFSKVATAADAGTPVRVPLSGSAAVSLQVLAYSGTSGTAPVVSVTGAADGAGTAHTTPVVEAAEGSMVLSIWSDKSASAHRFVAPSTVTERTNLAGTGTGDVATLVADSGQPVPAGTVGGQTATVATASSRATMLTVVLREAEPPAPPAPNQAPTALISSSCAALDCAFDGSGSTDLDGSVDSYAWEFGDGQSSTEAAPRHSYAAAGEYAVTLTVTDDRGAVNAATATVTVAPAPAPQAMGLRASAGTAARPVTSVSVDVPAAVQAGDGLVLVLGTNSAVTGTAPEGWTLAATQPDGGKMTTQVFSRVATAADAGSTITVGVGTVSSALTLQLMAYSGTASTGPVASVTGAAGGGGGTAHTTPLADAPAGSWVLSIWSDKAPAARQFTAPAGLAERSNLAGVGNGDVATLVADSGGPVAGGQVGGLTATVPTASSRSTMLTVVLAPAG